MENDFSMPGHSRYMTQKSQLSEPGFDAATKDDFSNPGTNSKNYCTWIFRGRVSSIFRFSAISEFLKLKGEQRLEALGTAKTWKKVGQTEGETLPRLPVPKLRQHHIHKHTEPTDSSIKLVDLHFHIQRDEHHNVCN